MGWCHASAQRLDIIVLVARGAEAAALRPFTSALAAPVTTSVLTSPVVPLTVSAGLGPEVLSAVKGGVKCLKECWILLALFRHKPANVAPELAVNLDYVVDAGHLPSACLRLQVLPSYRMHPRRGVFVGGHGRGLIQLGDAQNICAVGQDSFSG